MGTRVGELSLREAAFVEAFVGKANGNATEAYAQTHPDGVRKPGDREQGHRMLKNVDVSQAILVAAKAVSEQTRRATIADAIEQEEFLTRVLRGEEFDVSVTRENGELAHHADVVAIEPRLKAADALAKRHGLIVTKLDAKQAIGGTDGGPLQIVVGSIEELRKLAEGTGDADDE